MKEEGNRLDNGDGFINLWKLFAQIGKAETAFVYEAARYLVSCLDSDPNGINYLRRRDESGIVLQLDLEARLHLMRLLSIFASQGTLFDANDRPTDEAQTTFERVGFYASDIYPYLAHHDVAATRTDDDESGERVFPDGRSIPGWILSHEGRDWISRSRAAKILLAGTCDAELPPPEYDEAFFRWDAALLDAIERGAIAVTTVSRKQMLAHADIRTWCKQHGYAWPLEAIETRHTNTLNTATILDGQDGSATLASRSLRDNDSGSTKRERQIRAIEEMADKLNYPRQKIPTGGKTEIRKLCKLQHPDLFGGGDAPFDDAWKVASKTNRIVMEDRNKFAGK